MYKWFMPDSYVPATKDPAHAPIAAHEAVCVLNDSDVTAKLAITVYYADREPSDKTWFTVPARRTARIILGGDYELEGGLKLDAAPETPYSLVAESEQRLHVQLTRVDTREAALALMTAVITPEES